MLPPSEIARIVRELRNPRRFAPAALYARGIDEYVSAEMWDEYQRDPHKAWDSVVPMGDPIT